jgi:hypothetical protein
MGVKLGFSSYGKSTDYTITESRVLRRTFIPRREEVLGS